MKKARINKFKFHIHTGPVIVKSSVQRMKEAGVANAHAGTEHAYGFVFSNDSDRARTRLSKAIGFKIHHSEVWKA